MSIKYLYEVTLERRTTVVERAKVKLRPGYDMSKDEAVADACEMYYSNQLPNLVWEEAERECKTGIDEDACTVKRTKLNDDGERAMDGGSESG